MTKHLINQKLAKGLSLIEALVFMVVLSIALTAVLSVFNQFVVGSVDPVVRVRAMEIAQAQLDEILSRKFDENTPTGGVPACDSLVGPPCAGIVSDSDFDDVGDYNGFVDNSHPQHTVTVTVSEAGGDLGLAPALARLIQVNVTMTGGDSLTLAAYRTNF